MKKAPSFTPNFKTAKFEKSFNGRKEIKEMYDMDWRKYSHKFLHYNPNCYSCGNKAEAVDHIEPHKGDEKLFWKKDNHLPLCHKCHNTITTLFDRDYRGKESLIKKLEWISRNRNRNLLFSKVKVIPSSFFFLPLLLQL